MTGPDTDSSPRLVLNDSVKGERVLSAIQAELHSCKAFRFYVAFVNQEGVACLLQSLADLRDRGVTGRILVSQYLNFTDPEALRALLKLDNLEVRIAIEGSMHAKGYYFAYPHTERYIIGSSNWTASALSSNTELNVRVETANHSELALQIEVEFAKQFEKAQQVTAEFIASYEPIYRMARTAFNTASNRSAYVEEQPFAEAEVLRPNSMQVEALKSLSNLRAEGKRKALIISATGTGKTLLSAFDCLAVQAKRILFVVHRENITRAALETYRRVFGCTRTYGLYSGSQRDQLSEFIFSTVQTLSRPEHYAQFPEDHFDYIVVDESHRAGAASYARFLDHFRSSFLLGMTATPERTDGGDIFRYFDYNIAYEIRLQQALEEGLLCPFHYFGVTDLTVNGEAVAELSDFKRLLAPERVSRVIEKAEFYGCDGGIVRGLIFCSRNEEAEALSVEMNRRGYRTCALSGQDSELAREVAILRLESEPDDPGKLDYIVTVDIFNEGVDIPQVNQIILLRPTQSAIVFVQQLGRGLRKLQGREKYLTVIDFIGSYTNNYLIPIALYGDRSYDKDRVRRLLVSGSNGLPGTSTINFDLLAKERIFESINSARTLLAKDLRADFNALKNRIGRVPMMMDFVMHDLRDPMAYIVYAKSFYGFARSIEADLVPSISSRGQKVLETLSRDGLNGKSLEEALLLKALIERPYILTSELNAQYTEKTKLRTSDIRWTSAYRSVNLRFLRENVGNRLVPIGEAIGLTWIEPRDSGFARLSHFEEILREPGFESFLRDLLDYASFKFLETFSVENEKSGFQRYRKYSRSDVFRILGAEENPIAQNVGGYLIGPNKAWCPLFVTYHKEEDISATVRYEDEFLNPSQMKWFTKSNRTVASPDVQFFKTAESHQRVLLFVQKNNDEGIEFYYMGDVSPVPDTFEQTLMPDGNGGHKSVVHMMLTLDQPVEDALYRYITTRLSS